MCCDYTILESSIQKHHKLEIAELPLLAVWNILQIILTRSLRYKDFADFAASSMAELFRTVDVRRILDFIKETRFYNKVNKL